MRIAVALALALAGAMPAAAQDCTPRLTASLAMGEVDGILTIPAAINGRPTQMMLSPSLERSSLSVSFAREAGLEELPVRSGAILLGGRQATTYAKVETLTLGGNTGQNVSLLIAPFETNTAVAGALGIDVLGNFDVDFDFAARKVNLFAPNPCDGAGVYWEAQHGELDLDKPGSTRMTLDGEEVNVGFDTMAGPSTLQANVAKTLFHIDPRTADTSLPANPTVHTFAGLSRGPFAVAPVVLHLAGDPDAPVCDGKWHTKLFDGIRTRCAGMGDVTLGREDLKKFHLYFAFKKAKLYFTPAP